jgi:hypothetical protein
MVDDLVPEHPHLILGHAERIGRAPLKGSRFSKIRPRQVVSPVVRSP